MTTILFCESNKSTESKLEAAIAKICIKGELIFYSNKKINLNDYVFPRFLQIYEDNKKLMFFESDILFDNNVSSFKMTENEDNMATLELSVWIRKDSEFAKQMLINANEVKDLKCSGLLATKRSPMTRDNEFLEFEFKWCYLALKEHDMKEKT